MESLMRPILISVRYDGVVRAPVGCARILRGYGIKCKLHFMEECAESMT